MTVCPLAAWKPVGNHGGPMSAQLGLVLHVQEGNGGLSGWFNNPSSGASSTYWVSKAGALEQYVACETCAWAQASGNSTYQSVETEGFHTEPLTPAQEDTLAALYAWGAASFGWQNALAEAPGQRGFGWHGMGGSSWGGHTGCPGDLRKPRRQPILDAAFGTGPTPNPAAPGGGSEDNMAVVTAPGRVDLFVVGTDHGIWQSTGADLSSLAGARWARLGDDNTYAKAVSAAWTADYGQLYLTVHGADDKPYTACWDGQRWSEFAQSQHGDLAPDPYR